MSKSLKLNISPCPNDTFMFHALVNGLIDVGDFEFDLSFADIEELNKAVMGEKVISLPSLPHISKISYAVLPHIVDHYVLLNSGSALGRGNGPLLISNKEVDVECESLKVAIPGEHTTAYLLMRKLYPNITNYSAVLFSEIAERVAQGEFDAGVLIHEGRFTYAEKGLTLIADLGMEWERQSGLPLPLGGIVVSRELPVEVQIKIDKLVKSSVAYAMANPKASADFVQQNAQELSSDVTRCHIELFVNQYSLDLGIDGKKAVQSLTNLMRDDLLVK